MRGTYFRSQTCFGRPGRVTDDPSVPVGTLLGPDRKTEQRRKVVDGVSEDGGPWKNSETPLV